MPSWRHPLHRRVLPSLSFPNGRLLVGGALRCAVSGRARPAAWEQAEDKDQGDGCLAEGCAPRPLLQCGSRALTQAMHWRDPALEVVGNLLLFSASAT